MFQKFEQTLFEEVIPMGIIIVIIAVIVQGAWDIVIRF